MKKYFVDVALMFCLGGFVGVAGASDFLVINRDVTGDGKLDEVKLVENSSLFYTLSIISNGQEILRNENLVPKDITNKGAGGFSRNISCRS
jgi:hypothetical protein